jgi:hypothetical protein
MRDSGVQAVRNDPRQWIVVTRIAAAVNVSEKSVLVGVVKARQGLGAGAQGLVRGVTCVSNSFVWLRADLQGGWDGEWVLYLVYVWGEIVVIIPPVILLLCRW